jgi:hypothetical protein
MEISGATRPPANPPDAPPRLVRPAESGAAHDAPPPPPPPDAPPPRGLVEALANKVAENTRNGSRIRVDEATDRIVVQILNANNEVIKQLPPEDLLRAIAKSREITGLLFDQQT